MQGRVCATNHARRITHMRNATAVFRTYACVVLISTMPFACAPKPEVVIHTRDNTVRVQVELALTPDQQERGLMYRQNLSKHAGMLFVFAESEIHGFWMKNTPLPLDMIFIDDDREIVGIVENTVPFSTTTRTVGRASRYVLEVNAGFAAEYGIKAGQTVDLPVVSPPK